MCGWLWRTKRQRLAYLECFDFKTVELEKVSNDKENRINKIKAVAVKAKKELDASKKQVGTQ